MQTKAERWWDGPWPWLIYLVFYAVPWLWARPAAWQLAASAVGLAVFLPVYFASHRLTGTRLFATAGVMLLVGAALAPVGGGWTVFPIYAASEAGRARPARGAAIAIALIAIATIAIGLGWRQPLFWWAAGVMLVIATGGATISRSAFYARTQALLASQEEVRRLAGTAERERITRDLHDVVGRTLTLAALKADLAAKLAAPDPARAEAEMRAVAGIARAGLAEVRAALAGQGGSTLAHEIAASREALAAAGIAARLAGNGAAIPADAGAVLAMTLREAVTNVIRHAEAGTCTIELALDARLARLVVADDGVGRSFREGLGLAGMRQRLTAAGGSLSIQPDAPGTRLVATVPA
ncbi:sensor histidine kinase [uncultured Sphingomonas sp.]|uniref:sensor histidine kinase n=1 Tax=uncultured Sphingomonas sp. TaxID=158754 RepID=UPI0035CB1944